MRIERDPTEPQIPIFRPQMDLQEFAALPLAGRTLKTHSQRAHFLDTTAPSVGGTVHPLAVGTKVIYVSRNAADACVSAFYHRHNNESGIPFDAFVRMASAKPTPYSSTWHA